jgi:hypothetical protein
MGRELFLFAFINLNTYRIMIDKNYLITAEDKPWRVIGNWSAFDTYGDYKTQTINYGFDSKELAMDYLGTLEHIAQGNEWVHNRKGGHLSVSFAEWSNLKQFVGSYRVAQYINN